MKGVLLFNCIFSLGFTACNYIPCSASSDLTDVKTAPPRASIAGIYKPDKFTRQDYKEYSNADSTFLLLSEDGQITLNDFPKEAFDNWNELKTAIVNGSGTWTIGRNSGRIIIKTNINFDQGKASMNKPFRLFKKDGKYYILIDFGDPDACEAVRLEQQ
jgi:hypothetical protein